MRPANQFPASLSSGSSGGQHLPMAVLRQYVAGTLPAAEQHQVEAHTLACSRCADVLEGLSQTDLATTDQALTDLQARLRMRVAEDTPDAAPVVPMWPWRQLVAAVLLLLVGAGVWLGVRRTTEGPAAVARVARRPSAAGPAAVPPPGPVSAEKQEDATVVDNAVAAAPVAVKREETAPQPGKPRVVASRAAQARRPLAAPSTESAGGAPSGTAANPDVAATTSEPLADAAKQAVSRADTGTVQLAGSNAAPLGEKPESYASAAKKAKTMSAPAAPRAKIAGVQVEPAAKGLLNGRISSAAPAPAGTRMVRGRVTDQASGAGLPGVTVLAKGTTVGSSTAADGSFALVVPDSVKTLTFHYIGYNSSEQTLSTDDNALALALTPDNKSLNEVVVVRRERPPAPISVGALPAGGYSAFREYLKDKLEYPEKALKDGKSGTVKLRFTVAVDGSLQDIKVIQGLSEECDAEAIRLLKEGPRWYPAIAKGRRTARPVEISVPFRVNE